MEIRFDRGTLQRPTRRGDALVIEGYAARVHRPGDPLRYEHGDEYRDAAELKRLTDQLAGLPVTLGHPPGLLKSGAKGRIVGRIDSAWLDGDRAGVRLAITDAAAAREVESGTKELSLGYAVSVRSDGYQQDSEADHLAIVPAARCGATCSLRTDEVRLDCTKTCACSAQIDRSGAVTEASVMADKTIEERADELTGENKQLKARVAELEGLVASGAQAAESEQVKKATERADAAEAKVARFDETFQTAVRARTKLVQDASRVMGAEFRMDDMTDRQVHEAVVKRLDASADVKAVSDAELRGQFNTLVSLSAKNAESQQRVAEILGRTDSSEARGDREQSWEDIENNRWKKTLTNSRSAAEGR